jgi:hypothetical protein
MRTRQTLQARYEISARQVCFPPMHALVNLTAYHFYAAPAEFNRHASVVNDFRSEKPRYSKIDIWTPADPIHKLMKTLENKAFQNRPFYTNHPKRNV